MENSNKPQLIRTFTVDTGDSKYIYEDLDEAIRHVEIDIEEFKKKCATIPDDNDDEIFIQIKAEFKYTQEEVDNLPEP